MMLLQEKRETLLRWPPHRQASGPSLPNILVAANLLWLSRLRKTPRTAPLLSYSTALHLLYRAEIGGKSQILRFAQDDSFCGSASSFRRSVVPHVPHF